MFFAILWVMNLFTQQNPLLLPNCISCIDVEEIIKFYLQNDSMYLQTIQLPEYLKWNVTLSRPFKNAKLKDGGPKERHLITDHSHMASIVLHWEAWVVWIIPLSKTRNPFVFHQAYTTGFFLSPGKVTSSDICLLNNPPNK